MSGPLIERVHAAAAANPAAPAFIFQEPLDFIARLAALVPRPRAHLTRYHGVFAPHSRWRAEVTPKGRGNPPGN